METPIETPAEAPGAPIEEPAEARRRHGDATGRAGCQSSRIESPSRPVTIRREGTVGKARPAPPCPADSPADTDYMSK